MKKRALTVWLSFCILASMLTFTSCSTSTPESKVQLLEEIGELLSSPNKNKDRVSKKIANKMEKLGLVYTSKSQKILIDRSVLDYYLSKYSNEDLFYLYYSLDQFLDLWQNPFDLKDKRLWHCWHEEGAYCTCQRMKDFLTLILSLDYNYVSFNATPNQNDGFYSKNKNAEPESYEKSITGQFYSHSGENVHYEEKTNIGEVTYYKDFAILYEHGYTYDKGAYGWKNGRFEDRLPSWSTFAKYSIYYCGKCLITETSLSALRDSDIKVVTINNTRYLIYKTTFSPGNPEYAHTICRVQKLEI